MRKIYLVFFMLIGVMGFAQEVNQTDAQGQKQGVWKKYHENGALRYVGQFKNNQPIGEFKYFDTKGKLQSKMNHKNGSSYFIAYYATGEVKAVGKYIQQKRDSTWTFYTIEGHKQSTEFYRKGLKNRVSYIYYPNGKIAEEKAFFNDFENGKWIQYFSDGKKKMEATYENGGLEGEAIYYRTGGKRSVRGYYYHGTRTGVWLFFDTDGNTIKKKETYKNGRRVGANKDENVETTPLKPISEEQLNPDFMMKQMNGNH